ncbi:Cyclin-D1-binding protein 1 homolog [Linum perenne]
MGKKEKERLNQVLNSHLNTIHDTLQILDQTPASSLDKVSWDEVVKMGDQVYRQATIVGMLWTGEKPEAKAIEENMSTYFNALQGFLLLSHGSRVGAGPTLSSSIYASVKQVVDCSFKLMSETVASYGSRSKDLKLLVPKLVGAVWEACNALKKTPSTNTTAIGRAMTRIAVSMKDVLREMNELKPESPDPTVSEDAVPEAENGIQEGGGSLSDDDDDDLGNDLSPEDMKVAELATEVVSQALVFIKELVRTISGLIKLEKPNDSGNFVDTLEKLLKLCQGIGEQIDELGACLYPPQEFPAMKTALDKISNKVDEAKEDVESLNCSAESFFQGCTCLKSSIKVMETELDSSMTADLGAKLQNVSLNQ